MKFFGVLLLATACFAAVVQTPALKKDLEDINAMVPWDQIRSLTRQYIQKDRYMGYIVDYLKNSQGYKTIIATIANNKSWQAFEAYLLENQIDFDAIFQCFTNAVNSAQLPEEEPTNVKAMINDYIGEVLQLVDLEKIREVVDQKRAASPEFKAFWASLTDDDSKQLVDSIRNLCEVEEIIVGFLEMDINIVELMQSLYKFYGWEYKPRIGCH